MSRRHGGGTSPFAVLGLPARAGLADDEVRAAWRRVAAATHPDRADGGDPGRFAAAAAAYTMLRTASGRGEALADLAGGARRAGRAGPAPPGPDPVATPPAAGTPPAGTAAAGTPGTGMPGTRTAGTGARGVRGPGQEAPGQMLPGQEAPGRGRPGRGRPGPGAAGATARARARAARLMTRVRGGRPARLGLRVLIVAATGTGAAAVAGAQPATPALIAGALTWLVCTARQDLAPPG